MKQGGRRVTTAARGPARFTQADVRAAVAGLRGSVSFQAPLREYTSFKIGGPADVVVEPADIEDVCLVVQQARARKIPLFVLGGTNLLIRDGGIRGIVVSLVRLRAIKEIPGSILYAEGGVGMPTLIGYAIRHSLAGLEWAAGIPGTVAGCVVMNAGTKLGEMKDSVKAVRMVNMKGQVVDVEAAQVRFEYRRALLPRGIVVGVWVQLKQGVRSEIERVVKDYLHLSTGHAAACDAERGLCVQEPSERFRRPIDRGGWPQGCARRRCGSIDEACQLHGESGAGACGGCDGVDWEGPQRDSPSGGCAVKS